MKVSVLGGPSDGFTFDTPPGTERVTVPLFDPQSGMRQIIGQSEEQYVLSVVKYLDINGKEKEKLFAVHPGMAKFLEIS